MVLPSGRANECPTRRRRLNGQNPQQPMKEKAHRLILGGLLALALLGCATSSHSTAWRNGTTTIDVTGEPGSLITGFYLREDSATTLRVACRFVSMNSLSEVEIRKVNRAEAITIEVRYADPERHMSSANMAAAPGVPGYALFSGTVSQWRI